MPRKLNEFNSSADVNVILPRGNDKNYLSQVIKYVKKHKINFILPCSDEEAITLSNNLEKFEKLKCLCSLSITSM